MIETICSRYKKFQQIYIIKSTVFQVLFVYYYTYNLNFTSYLCLLVVISYVYSRKRNNKIYFQFDFKRITLYGNYGSVFLYVNVKKILEKIKFSTITDTDDWDYP